VQGGQQTQTRGQEGEQKTRIKSGGVISGGVGKDNAKKRWYDDERGGGGGRMSILVNRQERSGRRKRHVPNGTSQQG